jgi:hypothetical protein
MKSPGSSPGGELLQNHDAIYRPKAGSVVVVVLRQLRNILSISAA